MSSVIDVLKSTWEELTAPGAQFAWSEQEVRGIKMRVFDQAPPHMRFMWELSAGYGDKPYIVYEDEMITYDEAHAAVRSLAHHLRDEHGVGTGDRVAIAMRNYPEWALAYWAVISLGAAVVGVNAWWTSAELEYGLNDSRPSVVIADDERLERLLPVLDSLRAEQPMHVISVRSDRTLPDADRWDDIVDAANAPDTLPEADIDPDDDMCIFYTSGTTGFPKGAQLTHRGSVHNLLHLAFANTSAAIAASRIAEQSGEAEEKSKDVPPTIMVPTPLFHVTANNCVLHPGTASGAKLVFMHKWDAGRALELIEREQVVSFTGVPTMSREMLQHPDWETRDTSSMAMMGGGGAAVDLSPDGLGIDGLSHGVGRPHVDDVHLAGLRVDLYLGYLAAVDVGEVGGSPSLLLAPPVRGGAVPGEGAEVESFRLGQRDGLVQALGHHRDGRGLH